MPTAIGLALFFIKSCSLSAWKRKDGTCSASVRGLRMPYTILHCGFGVGYHSPFFGHSMNTTFNCISFFFFRISLSYRAFTISKKSQEGGRVELYVNRLYKGFLDRSRFFLLRCFKLSIFNNKCTFFFNIGCGGVFFCFFWGGEISHTEQLSIIFLQHWHHNSKCKLLNKSCSYRNIYLDLCN